MLDVLMATCGIWIVAMNQVAHSFLAAIRPVLAATHAITSSAVEMRLLETRISAEQSVVC